MSLLRSSDTCNLAVVVARAIPAEDAAQVRKRLHLNIFSELGFVVAFYLIYSAVRNKTGSSAVGVEHAFNNAEKIIDLEKAIRLWFEPGLQQFFVTSEGGNPVYQHDWSEAFLRFWNVFYGTFHFGVTAFVLVWLFARYPKDYPKWRSTLGFTTFIALIGFATFPLMPPRLLAQGGEFGGLALGGGAYPFVDTLEQVGGLWSFQSGPMQAVSNQYAAMPSLHFGWSLFCALALYPRLEHRAARIAIQLYPLGTLAAIVVTANHYWIDAVGGALVVGCGYLAGSLFTNLRNRMRHIDSAGEPV